LHAAVHGNDFTKWARNTGVSKQQAAEWGQEGGKVGGKLQPREVKVKNGEKSRDLGLGFHAPGVARLGGLSGGSKGGRETHRKKTGMFAMSKEEQSQRSKKAGKTTAAQRWRCLVTGHVSSAGSLARFQRARNIDTSLRERLE